MRIKNHKLIGIDYVNSPNQSGSLKPEFLVIHFTAGRSAEKAIATLTNKKRKASAHLVISRTGKITQLVPFNKKAWHAGASTWKTKDKTYSGLNSFSIGIELDNYGSLVRNSAGKWETWFGTIVPDEEVVIAKHKHGGKIKGWHKYSEEQLEALEQVAELLFDHYKLKDVIGHEDIAPGRKTDPGPAFKMDSFRAMLIGRDDDNDNEVVDESEAKHEIYIPEFLKFNPF